jgi:CTLH/CRA C-terminal to LisH motif domain
MALLAFGSAPNAPSAIADLLSPAQRLKTAGEVNAAILESMSQGKEVKLVALLKLLCWGDTILEEKADFPKVSKATVDSSSIDKKSIVECNGWYFYVDFMYLAIIYLIHVVECLVSSDVVNLVEAAVHALTFQAAPYYPSLSYTVYPRCHL